MRVLIQRVSRAEVEIGGSLYSKISYGMLVFVAFRKGDGAKDIDYMVKKVLELRIFSDEAGVANKTVEEVGGEVMVVSQFTLYGSCRKGRRPSFSEALNTAEAKGLYNVFVDGLKGRDSVKICEGKFQAKMEVKLSNCGPYSLLLDSEKVL